MRIVHHQTKRDRKYEIEREIFGCQTIIHRQASRLPTSGRLKYKKGIIFRLENRFSTIFLLLVYNCIIPLGSY